MYKQLHPLILASGSPRRKELLQQLGINFEVVASGADEDIEESDSEKCAEVLAIKKGKEVAEKFPDFFILSADTEVWFNGRRFGKPESATKAVAMLEELQGKTHEVWGGIALYSPSTRQHLVKTSCTKVTFRKMSPIEITEYVEAEEVMDKAGAYAAQGFGASIIEKIEGSYTNVIGIDLAQAVLLFYEAEFLKLEVKAANSDD